NTKIEESQFSMLKKLELSEAEFIELKVYSEQKGIKFLSTGFDLESLNFLETLHMGLWKIPSGEITNLPYLEFIGKQSGLIILSTGMCTLSEIREAIEVLVMSGATSQSLVILHCTTDYPTSFTDVNLRAMTAMAEEFKLPIGYSDHTNGIEVSLAAVALGATVIEKHFTLDKEMQGPDHKASLDPAELKNLVDGIRNIEKALGSKDKKPTNNELENIKVARKSIVAKVDIKEGEIFTWDNLTTKRPGTGISPMKIKEIFGQKAKRNFSQDEIVEI
ncbi:MAG: N-acetylneuraminate synthase family protein, partial [Bdellovibrionales bacterium]|nr:N-acetylneuraminate synthase family protein [Bdellovibrionales bacterium]